MQTVERPRFRQDLVAEPIEDGATRFIDVADPDSGQLFRFYEVEYSLACAMDGERDVPGIVRWAKEELGLEPSLNEVRTVVATLGSLGFLDSGAAVTDARPAAVAAPDETPLAAPTAASARPSQASASVSASAGTKQAPPKPQQQSNRWDPPAATAPTEEVLGRGVVAGPKRASSPVADVELGTPGMRPSAKVEEVPRADFELGAPGGTASATSTPARKGDDDFALGAPGATAQKTAPSGKSAPSVSTDLAADMAISTADVKEAVRASQVMKAVDMPADLAAELEAPSAPSSSPRTESARTPEAKPEAPVAHAEPEVQPSAETKPKPIDMPTARPIMPTAPTAPSSGVSPLLIAALVVALLAAGGFLVYKYVIKKPEAVPASSSLPAQPAKPEPPSAPPAETAKLTIEQPQPEEIKTSTAATIATIVANNSAVMAGDPIVRLVGYKPLETDVAALQKQIEKTKADAEKATKDRDAAQTAGNKARITTAENKLAAYSKALGLAEGKLATKTAALDKLLVKAPAAGKITAVATPNAKVTPTDIIATLARDPLLVATFKSTGEVTADARVLLAIAGSAQKLTCTVVATGGDGTKIACPKDAAPEGTEVTYAGVDPSAPAAGETPAAPPAPDKAAAPSAEPAGDKPGDPAGETPADLPAEAPVEKPATKAAVKRPARRPRPAKPATSADKPADKPADAPAKPADPAPAPSE